MDDEAISLANYIGGVVQGDAIEFMRRSRSGVSSSMNGALEYTGLKVAEKALAWFAPIRADLEARAAAAERERDALRAAQQWQPIETAPHEELVLLGWVQEWPDRRWKMELGLASAGERISNGYSNRWQHAHATHWMPIPSPARCAARMKG